MKSNEFQKDQSDHLDYMIDWSDWLVADTISASSWAGPSGINIDSDSNTTTVATVWLSGGLAGHSYKLVNSITTAGGRQTQQTLIITMAEK